MAHRIWKESKQEPGTAGPGCPQIHATSLTKVAYYVCFGSYTPLSADVLNGSPLTNLNAAIAVRSNGCVNTAFINIIIGVDPLCL